ncbi:hypothetical protein RI129_003493 [Pyrocoelia pectoralis]|uniref:Dimethyladenosine transferase 2, mitochondrial n=1 Tax=Pyrocoelia pectoralis TaxID=417401 RepID=A0AAN7VQB9_9COLE
MLMFTLFYKQKINGVIRRFAINAIQTVDISSPRQKKLTLSDSYNARIERHFNERYELKLVKEHIPKKYLTQNRQNVLRNLYLVNSTFAKDIVKRILPYLKNKDQVICESNAGLGLISTELIRRGIKKVRLYEACAEFRAYLRTLPHFPSKMDLYNKDIFGLNSISYFDKYNKANRVVEMLDGIPVRSWDGDPVMTIIGPMPNLNFLRHLVKSIIFQEEIFTYGRPQIFALMQLEDYHVLNASPEMNNLRFYQAWTVLFQLFFSYEVLHKYCKKSFLPWRNIPAKGEEENLLVKIVPKLNLPVSNEHLTHLYYFIIDGFKKGRQKVIATMEKWLPGIGVTLIVPPQRHKTHFLKNIDIFTEFGELPPSQIFQLFLIMLEHPHFNACPFIPMMESHLVKDETIDSDLAEVDGKIDDEKIEDVSST